MLSGCCVYDMQGLLDVAVTALESLLTGCCSCLLITGSKSMQMVADDQRTASGI